MQIHSSISGYRKETKLSSEEEPRKGIFRKPGKNRISYLFIATSRHHAKSEPGVWNRCSSKIRIIPNAHSA
jgi:hypothetical protein